MFKEGDEIQYIDEDGETCYGVYQCASSINGTCWVGRVQEDGTLRSFLVNSSKVQLSLYQIANKVYKEIIKQDIQKQLNSIVFDKETGLYFTKNDACAP